jgi:hypothetical protein
MSSLSILSSPKNFSNISQPHSSVHPLTNSKLALAVAITGLAIAILGFYLMLSAPMAFSQTQIIACTMENCSLITHTVINPTFLKGILTALSGILLTYTANFLKP